MSPNTFFCSELSRRVGERVHGTASTGAVWLLVEYPLPWGRRALEDSHLSADLKKRTSELLKSVAGARLLFIKRRSACDLRVAVFAVRCREREPFIARFDLDDYEQLPDVDVASVAAGRIPSGATRWRDPLFLVCTHGRRDKCCARYGNALYKSLCADMGETLWQSSHVGGDRFAANLVCFPHGLYYAHTNEEEGRRIVEEYRAGRLVLDKYRGRACYAQPLQAAEYFARTESGLNNLADLRVLRYEQAGEKTWRAAFHAPARELLFEATVTSRPSDFTNRITCHSEEEKSVPQFHLDALQATAYKPTP